MDVWRRGVKTAKRAGPYLKRLFFKLRDILLLDFQINDSRCSCPQLTVIKLPIVFKLRDSCLSQCIKRGRRALKIYLRQLCSKGRTFSHDLSLNPSEQQILLAFPPFLGSMPVKHLDLSSNHCKRAKYSIWVLKVHQNLIIKHLHRFILNLAVIDYF